MFAYCMIKNIVCGPKAPPSRCLPPIVQIPKGISYATMVLHTSKRMEIKFSQNGFLNNFPQLFLNVPNANELKNFLKCTSASVAITCLCS